VKVPGDLRPVNLKAPVEAFDLARHRHSSRVTQRHFVHADLEKPEGDLGRHLRFDAP
jgi:hypothetical protein